METRKSLLAAARQFRTCPPPSVAQNAEYNMLYRKHLSLCPYCASGPTEDLSGWDRIAEKIRAEYGRKSSDGRRHPSLRPGQLRFIRPDLARWQDGFYYSPPLVLVLELTEVISDDVLVAQTYFDPGLAGPGDLILSRKQTGCHDFDLFVETWNCYTLKASCLAHPVGKNTGADVVSAVLSMDRNPEHLPEWAVMPRPMIDEHDPRIFFRKLEIEVGSVFSIPAFNSLMDEEDRKPVQSSVMADLMDAIQNLVPDAYWIDPPGSMEETLAMAQLRRLSAADADQSEITAKFAVFQDGVICHCTSLKAHILEKQSSGGKLAISGRIVKPPTMLNNAVLIAFLDVPGRKPLLARRREFDGETGTFYVEFTDVSRVEGRLELAVSIELSSNKDDNRS